MAQAKKKKKKARPVILVVDDEALFRESVIDAGSEHDASWRLLAAENGRQALATLETERVDLVVTDLRMPELDGLGLLAAISNLDTPPRVIAVSAYATSEIKESLRRFGALHCLDKPIDLEDLLAAMSDALATPMSAIEGLTISGFVQLLEIERKTCLLRVRSEDSFADLVFDRGALLHALCGAKSGDEAAIEALSWNEVHLEILPALAIEERTVTAGLQHLLLEAARRTDEAARELDESIDLDEALGPAIDGPGDVPETRETSRPDAKEIHMANNVQQCLDELMEGDGAVGVALVDFESGMTLGTAGGGDKFNLEVAAAGNTAVVSSKMQVMSNLGLNTNIEDILITLGSQYHLIRPLSKAANLFLYGAYDRKKANLAMTRHKMAAVEAKLDI